jgi:hypothetical protein
MAEQKWKYLGSQSEVEFMEEARKRFHFGLDQDKLDRSEAEHDVKFLSGGDAQWDEVALAQRRPPDLSRPRRPVLTWNRLHEPIYQVTNDGRANKPSIKVTPMDGGTDETAEYFQSRIRQVEYESDADIAYDTQRQQAVSCGRGFIRIGTEF